MITYLDSTLAIDHYMWAKKDMPSNMDTTAPRIEFNTETKLTFWPYFNCTRMMISRAEGY